MQTPFCLFDMGHLTLEVLGALLAGPKDVRILLPRAEQSEGAFFSVNQSLTVIGRIN